MTIWDLQLPLCISLNLWSKLVTVSSSACSPEFPVDTVKSKCCPQPLESTGVKSKTVQPFKKRFGVCWAFLLLSWCCLLDRPLQKFSYALTTEISQSAVNWIHYATLKLQKVISSQEWEKSPPLFSCSIIAAYLYCFIWKLKNCTHRSPKINKVQICSCPREGQNFQLSQC